jgi:ABC-type nitrate/sulfonate/bicarbonate transport system substrate-binding protein
MAELPKLDVVIANNFGHLPMFIGAEKGFFKQHGVDASFRVVDTGTDMVNALHNGEAQVGDMSTTTYLKAVHAGNPFHVIGLIMNDASDDHCDTPLAIVTKKGRGINAGKIADVRGKKIGLAKGQTSDEYFKMVLRRAAVKYDDVAIVTWEPFVTQALTQVPETYEVIRGGQHMSYVMVAVAHGPTIEDKPAVIKSIAAGLAQSSHFTRKNPDEAVEIFAKWVPGTDVAIGKKSIKHIHFDPRMSKNVLQAFENAEDEVLTNTLKGAPRLNVPTLFRPEFMQQVEKEHPEYFADLPKL